MTPPVRSLARSLALALLVSGCALVNDYDFDGYRLAPGPRDAAAGADGDGDSSTGRCVPFTCSDLRAAIDASCGRFSDGCGGTLACGACAPGDA